MTAPIRLRLDQATRTAVSERYEHTRGAVERNNCQIVLLADEGRHAPEVAWLVRHGPHQVRKVLHRFQVEGLAGLAPHKAPGRALEVTPAWRAELRRVIDLDPRSVDISSAVWTTRLLSAYLEKASTAPVDQGPQAASAGRQPFGLGPGRREDASISAGAAPPPDRPASEANRAKKTAACSGDVSLRLRFTAVFGDPLPGH
jgi:transposase